MVRFWPTLYLTDIACNVETYRCILLFAAVCKSRNEQNEFDRRLKFWSICIHDECFEAWITTRCVQCTCTLVLVGLTNVWRMLPWLFVSSIWYVQLTVAVFADSAAENPLSCIVARRHKSSPVSRSQPSPPPPSVTADWPCLRPWGDALPSRSPISVKPPPPPPPPPTMKYLFWCTTYRWPFVLVMRDIRKNGRCKTHFPCATPFSKIH